MRVAQVKTATVLGTRPEIIRLSRLIPLLDSTCEHTLIHTGQNHDPSLSDLFFDELAIRKPDIYLGVDTSSFGTQVGAIIAACGRVFQENRPDRLLILGDTNSALAAFVAKRMGIPVYHMEAGNRCFDDRVPEEVNRRVIDHCSDVLMPYTERSRQNLIAEGVHCSRVFVTGNPIHEVLLHHEETIDASPVLSALELDAQEFFLVTLHRAENVDESSRLASFVEAFSRLRHDFGIPVIVSTHPRTRSRLQSAGYPLDHDGVRYVQPLGLFDFVKLEKSAKCVLTDSGTVQEECCILGIPTVTLRDATERPETMECGSNILSGCSPTSILNCAAIAMDRHDWTPPPEYMVRQVSQTVLKIMNGYRLQNRNPIE
jgi:UDP-N-acetylglucosamine 2-epimerase (non-hydrolysing)